MQRTVLGIMAFVSMLIFCAGPALAGGTFDVTSKFGQLIENDTTCGRVGEITLEAKPNSGSFWDANTTITVELLGNDLICQDTDAYYVWDANASEITFQGTAPSNASEIVYEVHSNTGDDFFEIVTGEYEIGEGATAGTGPGGADLTDTKIVIGQADPITALCFDISGTAYNPADPNNQRVLVSYADSFGNTYSGDDAVATVKDAPPEDQFIAEPCVKNDRETIIGSGWDTGYNFDLAQAQVVLNTTTVGGSNQVAGNCTGVCSSTVLCVRLEDLDEVVEAGNTYTFTISENYNHLSLASTQLVGADGTTLTASGLGGCDGDVTSAEDADTAEFAGLDAATITSTNWFLLMTVEHDCQTAPGDLDINVQLANDDSLCGAETFSAVAEDVATLVTPEQVLNGELYFPYSPDFAESGWWAGVALTNMSAQDAAFNLFVYEADGDLYTGSVDVVAQGLDAGVFTASGIDFSNAGLVSLTTSTADAAFGDERFWMYATTAPSNVSGFFMTGDGTQAQGYLPINPSVD